jgi:monoamine oxidase
VLSLDDEFHVVLDNSPPESSRGVLAGFLEAAHARTAAEMTGDERRKLITSTLVNYFGAQAAGQFDIVEQGLNGRGVHPLLLRGHVGTGVRTGTARRAAPVGRVHWAGSESSDVWNGYMVPSALGAALPP